MLQSQIHVSGKLKFRNTFSLYKLLYTYEYICRCVYSCIIYYMYEYVCVCVVYIHVLIYKSEYILIYLHVASFWYFVFLSMRIYTRQSLD